VVSRKRFTRVGVLAVIALVAVTLMAVPGNATFAKKYDLTIGTPAGTAAGVSTIFTATYTNKSLFKIGSTDLSVPAGFSVTGATTTKGTIVSAPTSSTVQVRNLTLVLGASFQVKVTATIACGTSSPALWTAVTKEYVTGALFSINNPGNAQKSTFTDCPQTIEVSKYDDTNVNGVRDGDPLEPGLSGWEFALRAGTATTGTPLATGTTGPSGTTSFSRSPGQYTVCETLKAGWKNTDPGLNPPCETVTITGSSGASLSFGNARDVTLAITKYEDANLSGTQDPDEALLGGWEFTIREGSTVLGTVTTAGPGPSLGTASFSVPAGGTYTVCETIKPNWTSTDPDNGSGCRTAQPPETKQSGAVVPLKFGNAFDVGELGCPSTGGNTDTANADGAPTAALTRFENVNGECVLVPYVFRTGREGNKQFVEFIKNLESQVSAQFTILITWDPEPAVNPIPASQVQGYGPGGDGAAVDLEWCDPPTGSALYDFPNPNVPWCLVSQSADLITTGPNAGDVQVKELVYGRGDPRIVRG
jgi:hypothetical protein